MAFTSRRARGTFAAIAAAATLAGACSGGGGDGGSAAGIQISGSSTVEPISSRVAEAFKKDHPDVATSVNGPGTGDGFELFCRGQTDISDASRPIKAEEADACAKSGIEFIELKVAIDGLSVITSTENDAVECLSFADLYALVGPESTGFGSWSDANELDAELGGKGDLPDVPLVITAPGEESGTYDSFIEIAFKDIAEQRVADGKIEEAEAGSARPDYQTSAEDNVIIQGVAGNDTSLGWVGFAFAQGNVDDVKELAIDGGDGCIEPTPETIANGDYPLARDLFIYVNKAKVADKPVLGDLVDFYLSDAGLAAIGDAGYVDLAAGDLAATRKVWADRTAGTREG